MKNFFAPGVKEEVLSRIDRLQPGTKPYWGRMNVNQGMRHMSMAFDMAAGRLDPTVVKPAPMPKWMFKFFLLNIKPPKAKAQTYKEMDIVANNVEPTDFEMERSGLKKAIEDFCASDSFASENKIAGKFSKQDWGKLTYNHTDHHLRQFGV